MLDREQMHTTTITISAVENGNILKNHHQQQQQQHQQQNDSLSSSPGQNRNEHRSHRPNNITSSSSNNNTATETSYASTVSLSTIVSSEPDQEAESTDRSQIRLNQKKRKSCISFQDNLADNYLERGRRLHGLQLPLHPLQISGWIAILGFGVSTFSVLIPALDFDLQIPLYYIVGCLYVIHTISHLAALLIDPSDDELRKQSSSRIVPEFDRTKHAHVIENGRCHLCNIVTTPNFRTKHCSVCNKCVAQFDHHCKWLNHCIGGRNYVAFLMVIVSSVITAVIILAIVIAELVLYYMKSEWLIIWKANTGNLTTLNGTDTFLNHTDPMSSTIFNDTFIASINDTTIMSDSMTNVTDTMFDLPKNESTAAVLAAGISLHDMIFLVFISVLGILAAITVGLLLHLCFFHVYISFLGLTTYEYIRNQRQLELQKEKKSTETVPITNNKTTLNALKKSSTSTQIFFCSHIDPKNLVENHETKAKHQPKSIHCCDRSMQYENIGTHDAFYLCSILHDRPSPILVPSSMAHELTLNSRSTSRSKVFHCCSEYKQIVKLSDTSSHRGYNDDTTANNDGSVTGTSSIDENVKFFEQCNFCSFKLKTDRQKVSAIKPTSSNRKSITASQSSVFKRKWNCCSNVPESPDEDVTMTTQQQQQQQNIDTISESIEKTSNRHHHIHHRLRGSYDEHKLYHRNGAKSTENGSANKIRSSLSTNLKGSNRSRVTTQTITWPLRLRYMFRVFGRCQQPHYSQQTSATANANGNGCGNEIKKQSHSRNGSSSPRRTIKQNQIRPTDSIEQQQQYHQRHRQSHDPNSNNHMPNHLHKNNASNRRNDIADMPNSYNPINEIITNSKSMQIPPAPPARRKICQTVDMQDLAESLSFVQNPSHHHHHFPSRVNKPKEPPKVSAQMAQRSIGNGNNRRRRKNVFRTRSPNLSPIHESGYSNPTSPQPCRHSSSHGSDSSVSIISKMSHQQRKHDSVA